MQFEPFVFQEPKFNDLPSAWTEHYAFAYFLMRKLNPAVFVELGTHSGGSYFTFCHAIEQFQLRTKAFAIDTWLGDEHAGFYGDEIFLNVHNTNKVFFGSFSNLIRSTFDDAVPLFEDGSIDLLHIDGLHTYEAVKHDFQTWLPKMSDKGVILFHDTVVKERGFGVYQLMDELRHIYPYFEFEHGYGLGVLAVGSEIGDDIKELIEDCKEEFVQQLYASIGRKNFLERQFKLQNEKIDNLIREQDHFHQTILNYRNHQLHLERTIQFLEQQVMVKDAKLKELHDEYQNVSLKVELLEQKSTSLAHSVSNLIQSIIKVGKTLLPWVWYKKNKQRKIMLESGYFDKAYYLSQNPDVSAANMDPLTHFVLYGAKEGRNPSSKFDTSYYLKHNEDVLASGMNPLWHYLRYGLSEGRQIKAVNKKHLTKEEYLEQDFEVIDHHETAPLKIKYPRQLSSFKLETTTVKPLINQYFECIYVLYHPKRRHKFVESINRLKQWQIEVMLIEAVDGYVAPHFEEFESYLQHTPWREGSEFNGNHDRSVRRIDSPEEWGQLKSYRGILKDAKSKMFQRILILDEQFLLKNDFHEEFSKFIQSIAHKDWKFLFLGAHQDKWDIPEYVRYPDSTISIFQSDQPFYHPVITHGAFAVAIHNSQFELLIDKIESCTCPISHIYTAYFSHLWEDNIVAYPNLVIEDIADRELSTFTDPLFRSLTLLQARKWDFLQYERPCNSIDKD